MALKFLSAAGSGTTRMPSRPFSTRPPRALPCSTTRGAATSSRRRSPTRSTPRTSGTHFRRCGRRRGRDTDAAPAYPSSYDAPNVLSVAASDAGDERAFFSDYWTQVGRPRRTGGRHPLDLEGRLVRLLERNVDGGAARCRRRAALARSLHPGASDVGLKALVLRTRLLGGAACRIDGLRRAPGRGDRVRRRAEGLGGRACPRASRSTPVSRSTWRCSRAAAAIPGHPGERDAERHFRRPDGAGDGYYTGRFTASAGRLDRCNGHHRHRVRHAHRRRQRDAGRPDRGGRPTRHGDDDGPG